MIDRIFTLREVAAAFSTSPLSIVTACAEGKLPCWGFYDGEWVALTPAQIASAMKHKPHLIEMEPGSISWYLGGGRFSKQVPHLDEIRFRESEVSCVPGFAYRPDDSGTFSGITASNSKSVASSVDRHGLENEATTQKESGPPTKSNRVPSVGGDKKKARYMKRREANVEAVRRFLAGIGNKKRRDYYDDDGKIVSSRVFVELEKLSDTKSADVLGLGDQELLGRTTFIEYIGSHPDFQLPKSVLKSD